MAKEYIEREAARKRIVNNKKWSHDPSTMEYAAELVLTVPAADVVEVKHGEWLPDIDREYDYHCSLCRGSAGKGDYGNYDVLYDFCPNCGAKMDGERKTDVFPSDFCSKGELKNGYEENKNQVF